MALFASAAAHPVLFTPQSLKAVEVYQKKHHHTNEDAVVARLMTLRVVPTMAYDWANLVSGGVKDCWKAKTITGAALGAWVKAGAVVVVMVATVALVIFSPSAVRSVANALSLYVPAAQPYRFTGALKTMLKMGLVFAVAAAGTRAAQMSDAEKAMITGYTDKVTGFVKEQRLAAEKGFNAYVKPTLLKAEAYVTPVRKKLDDRTWISLGAGLAAIPAAFVVNSAARLGARWMHRHHV